MAQRKMGRKPLGKDKRNHQVMLRFNAKEFEELRAICNKYRLDIEQRGTLGPLLRRLLLHQEIEGKVPLATAANLSFEVNRIGNNINQLVKLAHQKNKRNLDVDLIPEINRTYDLMRELFALVQKNL